MMPASAVKPIIEVAINGAPKGAAKARRHEPSGTVAVERQDRVHIVRIGKCPKLLRLALGGRSPVYRVSIRVLHRNVAKI